MSRQRYKFVNRDFSHSKAKTPTRARFSLYQVVRAREPEWRENVTTKKKISMPKQLTRSEKTADILRRHHWVSCEMTSEKRANKFHTDDVLPPRSGKCF